MTRHRVRPQLEPLRTESLKVAYLTGRYPGISHTFILREVQALRRLGVDVRTFTIWRTPASQLLTDDDLAEQRSTFALLPPRALRFVAANAAALARHPLAYVRTLTRALRLGAPGARGRALALLWALEAIVVWRELERSATRHVHAHFNGTAPAVAQLTADFGTRVSDSPWSFSMTVHGPAEFYDVVRERLADKVRAAAFVVCISDFARAQLMSLVDHDQWSKLHVVHCGIDLSQFAPRDRRPAASVRLLNVGRLASVKGHAILLEAIALLARRGVRVEATVIGDGPAREPLERLTRELGIGEHVTLAGAVGYDEVPVHYHSADIFCMSSFAEGVPVVLMEAMAAGVPVVAPRIMGIPELIEDGEEGLLVPPGRADLLADAIARLATDPALRERLAYVARAKIAAEFTIEESARQLRDLFAAQLEAPDTPRSDDALDAVVEQPASTSA